MRGVIEQVSISAGGIPKRAIAESIAGPLGLAGDHHNHPLIHGGPRKAILLVSQETIHMLRLEGFPLFPGALGENLTVSGMDFRQIRVGQRFRAGDAAIEITQRRAPCRTLDAYNSMDRPVIQERIFDELAREGDPASPHWGISGFYASVVMPGIIKTGDTILLLDQAV
jgi:MOSC domain-containing protein YiiM